MERVCARDLFEGTKGRFKRMTALQPVLQLLLEHRYLRELPPEDRSRPGRKSGPTYEVNPLWHTRNSHDSHNSLHWVNVDAEERDGA